MYGVLIVLSVPMPLLAGWLSDRLGRKRVIVGAYVGGAVGFVVFIARRLDRSPGSGLGIVVMGLFSFAESPQLQALLADIAPADDPGRLVRALLHARVRGRVAVDGASTARSSRRPASRPALPIVFGLMAASFLAAARHGPAGPWAAAGADREPEGRGRSERGCYHARALLQRASGRGVAQLGSAYRSGR